MEYADLLKSGLGAVVGFALAQLVSVTGIVWGWFRRSKLKIERMPRNVILSHTAQLSATYDGHEEVYAFVVRNVGRKIATGVRFQILNIQYRDDRVADFAVLSDLALNLKTYSEETQDGREEITLVPKAAANIALARWRQDWNVVRPCAPGILEYYDEMCGDAAEYLFEIAVFDDSGDFATTHLTIVPGTG